MLLACCSATWAQTQVNCRDADEAATYAAGFNKRLEDAKANIEARGAAREQRYRDMRSRIVAAGKWSEKDADAFMLEVTVWSPEGKGLAAARLKAIKELSPLMFALGPPIVAGGDKQAERRFCIVGQRAMTQLDVVERSSNAAWEHLMMRVAAFGREHGVAGL